MTHEEIQILISAYIDGEVSTSEKTIVEGHLSTCPSCQKDYKAYKALSSSLSKWTDESLSPDETINVQRRIEQRREPMFSKRTLMTVGTTLALAIIVSSVVQVEIKNGVQGRLKIAAEDPGDRYTQVFKKQRAVMGSPVQFGAPMNAGLMDADLAAAPVAAVRAMAFNGPMERAVPVPMAKSAINNDHKVIRTANITIKVDNAQATQIQVDSLVTKYNGIIVNFQINKLDDGSRQGLLVLNILPKNLKNFLNEIRKLGEVQSEEQSGFDITNQYEFIRTKLKNAQTDRDDLQKILKKNQNNIDSNLYIQNEIDNVDREINSLQNNIRSLDDQSFMATVVVNFYDTAAPVVPKTVTFQEKIISDLKDNLKTTLQTCSGIAINSISGMLIALSFLLQIGVWLLILWVIFLIIRMFFKKQG